MTTFEGTGKRLNQGDIGKAAKAIGIETAVLLSFLEVEAAGRGFDARNRVKILTEAHIFYSNLTGELRKKAVAMGIAYAKWRPGSYNFDVYKRFAQMITLAPTAAFLSTSYGLGQIMGFNHKAAGHRSAKAMFEDAKRGEYEQLMQLVTLMNSWGMAEMLKPGSDFTNPDSWRAAARKYNGKSYAKHGYHEKMAEAYLKHSGKKPGVITHVSKVLRKGVKGEAVRNLQADLQSLGFVFKQGVDGRFGSETYMHVAAFQRENGLNVDGVAGRKTLKLLKEKVQQLKVDKSPSPPVFDKKSGLLYLIVAILKGLLK